MAELADALKDVAFWAFMAFVFWCFCKYSD